VPTTTPTLTYYDVSPDDEPALRRWYELVVACHAEDRPGDPLPGWAAWAGSIRIPMPDSDSRLVLVEADGETVGWFAQWLSTKENLDASPAELMVHPAHRRRGYGRAMVEEWTRRATELGRTRLIGEGAEGTGAAFAAALGFTRVLVDTQRRLELARIDEAHLAGLLRDAQEHSAGYRLLTWVGPTPEQHLAGIAALESRMTTDAPFDDLEWEQEVFDADRTREHDRVAAARGTRRYTTAAVHEASGEIAGYTTLAVFHDCDDAAYQWATIVAPEHRGHRLGMLLKIENLAHLRAHEPAVRVVDTWNAASNAPMLRVNLALGFEVVRDWAEYELRL
jgi:GNAT superfamily N-acetyltransferase